MEELWDERTNHILLVGEGDFSFTLSLVKQIDKSSMQRYPPDSHRRDTGDRVSIVSSSIESRTSVEKHKNATQNIQLLLDRGVEVLLGVDACTLNTHPTLHQRQFDAVIFNFPHIGGKSNIKRNRLLVQRFLQSAKHVLSPHGAVYLTLCQGQGGTPADSVCRAWHDTWQVVHVAAMAGFILRHVEPFLTSLFEDYACTGFRSQDKSFHTEGAMVHVLETADTVALPDPASRSNYITDRVNRNFLEYSEGPLAVLLEEIDAKIDELAETSVIKHDLGPELKWRKDTRGSDSESNIRAKLDDDGCKESIAVVRLTYKNTYCLNNSILRNTMLHNVPELLALRHKLADGVLVYSYGDVYRPCPIDAGNSPQSHEMIAVGSTTPEKLAEIIAGLVSDVVGSEVVLGESEHANVREKLVEYEISRRYMLHCVTNAETTPLLAEIFSYDAENVSIAVLHLESLLVAKTTIPRRLVFSEHRGVISQYRRRNLHPHSPSDTNRSAFKPISLYPATYFHDMSFWLAAEPPFDELSFFDIVRNMAGDAVMDVQLIDSYRHGDRESVCYHFTYRSLDKAMSYNTSWIIQSLVRLEVQGIMGITLR